jgi:hypothetical protein
MDGFDHQCQYYVEVEDSDAGYCLEGLNTTDTGDLYVIAEALQGIILTPEELASFKANSSASGGTQDISSSSSASGVARYFFSASGVRGVLEVDTSPPSICYSTQSSPIRPIKIVPTRAISHVEESYAPGGGPTFCDRAVSRALAADMIADPSGYQVVWSPSPGDPTAFSPLLIAPA